MNRFVISLLLFALSTACSTPASRKPEPKSNPEATSFGQQLVQFERKLELLRKEHLIPGMSAAFVRSNELVWSKGFGFSEIKSKIPAHPETVYHLSSLTKLFAATVVLQLVEEGKIDLDKPLSFYGIKSRSGETDRVTVRHLLTHTSESTPPGTRYRYNGTRFGELDRVLEHVTRKRFGLLLTEGIIDPLALSSTAPNPEDLESCRMARKDPRKILVALAMGYESAGKKPVPYATYFGTSAGMVSSVMDMAKFSVAYDHDRLLKPETRKAATTAFTMTNTVPEIRFPCGLGWFVQEFRNQKILWHHGLWQGTSALIVKIPDQGTTFVLLANSDRLSSTFDLGVDENVSRSPFARTFLDRFLAP